MLVLSRKVQEEIQVGDEIVVRVLKTGRNIVKIGIEAPKEISVVRGELTVPVEFQSSSSAERLQILS